MYSSTTQGSTLAFRTQTNGQLQSRPKVNTRFSKSEAGMQVSCTSFFCLDGVYARGWSWEGRWLDAWVSRQNGVGGGHDVGAVVEGPAGRLDVGARRPGQDDEVGALQGVAGAGGRSLRGKSEPA